jgi:hypothetical protein
MNEGLKKDQECFAGRWIGRSSLSKTASQSNRFEEVSTVAVVQEEIMPQTQGLTCRPCCLERKPDARNASGVMWRLPRLIVCAWLTR